MSGTDDFEIYPVMMCLFTGPLPVSLETIHIDFSVYTPHHTTGSILLKVSMSRYSSTRNMHAYGSALSSSHDE